MRRVRTVACPSCHARWNADQARFCGWCGVALRRTDLPDGDAREPREWPRRLVWTGGVLAGVAGLATVALLADGLRLPRSRPDPAVELADDGDAVVAQGEPLSRQERAELLAPFDPDRLRCEPEGCEVWRRDLATDPETGGSLEAVLHGGLVVATAGDQITALDRTTGEERWRRSWPRVEGRPATGWTIMLGGAATGPLVLVRPESGHLLALTPAGEVAWTDHEPRPMQNFVVAGDALITSHLERPGRRNDGAGGEITFPGERVVVRELGTGRLRWERPGLAMMGAGRAVVVAREGGDTLVLDAATGAEHGRQALSDDAWLYPVGQVLIQAGSGGTSVVGRDLAPLPGLEDLSEAGPVLDGPWFAPGGSFDPDLILGIRREADAALPTKLVLADGAGAILWEVDVPPSEGHPQSCCPNVHLTDDALLVPVDRGEPDGPGILRLALDDGAVLPPVADPPPTTGPQTWMVAPDVAIEQYADGIRLHRQDGTVDVQGGGWPLGGDAPFVFGNGRSLLAVRVAGGE